jgi:hypothetical protein
MEPRSPERRQVPLPEAETETAATLVPVHLEPVLRGEADGGIDYVCGNCGTTIAEQVNANQFYEFGVICGHCKTLVCFGNLPEGRPLPSGKTVVLNDGKFLLSATVNSGHDVVMAGEDAVRQRVREKGNGGRAFGSPQGRAHRKPQE